EAADGVGAKTVAAVEGEELGEDGDAGDLAAEALDEADGGFDGAAGGEEVVDDEDTLAWMDGIPVNLEGVGAVFERVFLHPGLRRELAGFANRYDAGIEEIGDGRAEDEAPALDDDD